MQEASIFTKFKGDFVLKKQINHKQSLKWLKHVVALANSTGGTIYFGIAKTGEIKKINRIESEMDFLKNEIAKATKPQVEVIINRVEMELNKPIIELVVIPSTSLVWLVDKKAQLVLYLRKDGKSLPANYEDLTKLLPKEEVVSYYPVKNSSNKYKEEILAFCTTPRSRQEIQAHIGVSSRPYFRENILLPLLQEGLLVPTNKNMRASNQKYQTSK